MVLGALWLMPGALVPLVAGQAVDAGVARGDTSALLADVALIVALGLAQMVFGGALDFLAHGMWLHAASAVQRHLGAHVLRLGASLAPQADSGEVTAVTTGDLNKIGDLFETIGRLAGAVVAFGVVGVGLFARSPLLGVVALVGVPLAVVGIGPLLAPLQRRRDAQRTELTAVNALAADIVAGLRILRGVGGEARFAARFADATARVRLRRPRRRPEHRLARRGGGAAARPRPGRHHLARRPTGRRGHDHPGRAGGGLRGVGVPASCR